MAVYPFHIHFPDTYGQDPDQKWPLILFLHGAGERGNDLNRVRKHGLPPYAESQKNFPFVVAYPQCPATVSWEIHLLNQWLEEVLKQVKYDPERVYLTGLSMGGFGTWHWAIEYPEKFAAIIPICGGGDTTRGSALVNMPVWAFHGAKDTVVPLFFTVDMIDAIQKAGGKPKLTIYPDLYHDSWTRTYQNPEIYEWLLSHRKKE